MTISGYSLPVTTYPPPPPVIASPQAPQTPVPLPMMPGDAWRTGASAYGVGTPLEPAAAHMDPNSFWPVGIALVSPVLALMGGAVGMVLGSAIGAGGAGLARGVGLGGSVFGLIGTVGALGHVFEDVSKGQLPSWSDVGLALQCALVPGLTCLGVGLGLSMGAPWLAGFMGLFGSALAYMAYFGLARRQP